MTQELVGYCPKCWTPVVYRPDPKVRLPLKCLCGATISVEALKERTK